VSHAVQLPSERPLLAFFASVGVHVALVLVLVVGARTTTRVDLPDSVAMPGNAIEVEAPSPELASAPGAPAPATESANAPVDVRSLPTEAAPPVAHDSQAPALPAPRKAAASRAKVVEKERPARAASDAPAALPGSATGGSSAPSSGTFGQEGLAPGVRRLGYAFTRAIPAATPADPAWRDLPPGHVGTIRIELEVDENNHLGALKRWQARADEPPPPAPLQRLVDRTLILLRAGQFALSGSNRPGTERLIIDVTLRDEDADADAGADDVVQKRFEGAAPGRPGKAYFRYGSGRALEAKVTVASSGS
jgi:hypothetical protein